VATDPTCHLDLVAATFSLSLSAIKSRNPDRCLSPLTLRGRNLLLVGIVLAALCKRFRRTQGGGVTRSVTNGTELQEIALFRWTRLVPLEHSQFLFIYLFIYLFNNQHKTVERQSKQCT